MEAAQTERALENNNKDIIFDRGMAQYLGLYTTYYTSGQLSWGVFYYIEIIAKNVEFYNLGDYIRGKGKEKDIYTVYCFDEEIRSLLRQYIEKAEFFYKDLIGNKFAELKCQTPPYDQHYDVKNYYDKVGITKTLQNFTKEKSYYKDSAIV